MQKNIKSKQFILKIEYNSYTIFAWKRHKNHMQFGTLINIEKIEWWVNK
jgi:hypothetical protein